MTTYAEAEAARQKAIASLRIAGLTAEAAELAASQPIVDRETAVRARRALYSACDAAARAACDELAASPVSSATADDTRDAYEAVADAWGAAHAAAREED